jgi:hypothetical protein
LADLSLPLDAFVRLVGINKGVRHSFFLGAGASITSGMPSAQACVWDWKRDIFLTNNLGLEAQFSELSLRSVRDRIQHWLDKQGIYPPEGSREEYATYIEVCYPVAESRKLYFQKKVRDARPHVGYELLCVLAEADLIRSVWTTNFDALVAKAAAVSRLTPVEVGIDCSQRLLRPVRTGELLIVSLHGDYRYDRIKNTTDELRCQERELQEALAKECQDSPLIVCGYSGRDSSIMETLMSAVSKQGTGALYWCVQDEAGVPPSVEELISIARKHNREAFVVPTHGFDDLLVRIGFHCLEGEYKRKATEVTTRASSDKQSRAKFEIDKSVVTGIIKGNLFEVECSSEALSCELSTWPDEKVWAWVRQKTEGSNLVAVPLKHKLYALGKSDDLKDCFRDELTGLVGRSPISERDLRYEDSAISHLMRVTLTRTLAQYSGVETDGARNLWLKIASGRRQEEGIEYTLHDSVSVSLRQIAGRQYLLLKPSIRVLSPDGTAAPRKTGDAIRMAVLGYQHNKEFNDAVNLWRGRLFGTKGENQALFEFPQGCASSFRFLIRRAPVFASIRAKGAKVAKINVAPKFRPLLKQFGLEVNEPRLIFSTKDGKPLATDVHPVRGIVNNRPFDFPLTKNGLKTSLRLGVICPKTEAGVFANFLDGFHRSIKAGRNETDYLPNYPGFNSAFRVPIEIPATGSPAWFICPEPPSGTNERNNAVEIARNINRGLEALQSSCAPDAVIIFFPTRWSRFRRYETDTELFDVHDFVKANGVQRGIGTQFLEQSTLDDPLPCRVRWWLSLALYVKAMRTPWVLEELHTGTAFVGLGVSVNRTAEKDKRVVLGCSHIYSSRGEGLQYRLSKVENPVYRGRNPFLSREDARRVGETIHQLFFDFRYKLPERVVIHKRTPFTKDERLGLQEGLSGVQSLEMLEIVADHSFRYVASFADREGNLHEDNYPVRRGTAVKLDDYSALVWLHGATSLDGSNRRYYQGKRRIPTPLLIHRHAGDSALGVVAEEVLGLSKMNWNTFDLYTRLPATIQSSNEIARIGSLLDRFGSDSYDFRLFI